MPNVLFVCTGNICRSAYAERYAQALADRVGERNWHFSSAGTSALIGEGMDELMAAELRDRGGDATGFTSRQLRRPLLTDADLIITMEAAHRERVLEEEPAAVRRTFSLGQLARLLDEIPREVSGTALIDAAGALRDRARRREDVADPYRRGADAAAAAAATISYDLEDLLAALFGLE